MVALIALLPFFFSPVGTSIARGKMLVAALLLLGAGVSWGYAQSIGRTVRFPRSPIFYFAAGIPLAYALSWAVGGFTQLSLVGSGVEQDTLVASLLAFAALALSAVVLSGAEDAAVIGFRALTCGAVALFVVEFLHMLAPWLPLSPALAGAAGNAFGSWHELGIIAGLFLFFAVALYDTALDEGVWRFVFIAAGILSFLFLIVADFTDIWEALVVLSALALAYYYAREGRLVRHGLREYGRWLALLCVSVLFVFIAHFVWNILPSSMQVSSVEVRPSWQGTLGVGMQVLHGPRAVIFGTGPNTFTRAWSQYRPAAVAQTQYWNSDFQSGVGGVPTAIVTLGLLGALAWLLFLGACAWSVWKYAGVLRRVPEAPVLFAIGLGALYLLVFHILYAPQAALNLGTFLLLGVFIALETQASSSRVASVRLGWGAFREWRSYCGLLLFSVGLLALLACAFFVIRVNVAEALIDRSVAVYDVTGNVQRADTLLSDALLLYPSDERARRAKVELGIAKLQALANAPGADSDASRAQLRAELQATIEQGLTAVSSDGTDYQNWLELASLYQTLVGAGVPGAYDSAHAAYEQALSLDPNDPLLYLRMAELDQAQKNPDAALKDIGSALTLKPDFAAAYYLQSQIYVAKNDLVAASSSAALSVHYAPQDPLGWYNAGAIAFSESDWQSALTDEQQALALNPQYANALYVLGIAETHLGRRNDALSTLQALDALDPGKPEIEQQIADLKADNLSIPDATTTAP